MPKKSDGTGTIYKRGDIWWVKVHVDGKAVYKSTKSRNMDDAKKLRRELTGKIARRELSSGSTDRILIDELLDDVLKSNIAESTRTIWKMVVKKHLRPAFGKLRAARLTTDLMHDYRRRRVEVDGVQHSTVNRELSIVRTAMHLGRKQSPPKVHSVPSFPIVAEENVRTGFLADEDYQKLLAELPFHLKALFIVAHMTGIRRGELLALDWRQIDFHDKLISLEKSKNGSPRTVPIVGGDMRDALVEAKAVRDECWPNCPAVFARNGARVKDFRQGWDDACTRAGLPDLTFHDLRRTAVRNMRRAGVPQVVRMAISGHKTESMERRYNIVDTDDIDIARRLMSAAKTANKQ